jgi:amino acid adenylation domain-containing protein
MLHHIVGDMSSLGVLFRDLAVAYENIRIGTAPALTEENLTLADHAREQRGRAVPAETLDFWRERLKDFTTDLDFPLDRFRPRLPSFRGDAVYTEIPAQNVAGLRTLARQNKCSLYMLCLAALQVLVRDYTGQERFSIGTPFSDRDDPRLENTAGYLINLLPIPCSVDPSQSFRDLLAKVRATCVEIYGHHQIAFRTILQELGISSDSPKPPLARIVFQYFPETAVLNLPGLDCSPMQVHSKTSKFDLCFSLWEQDGRITSEIEFDTDIFERSTVERIARHFGQLLRSITENSTARIASLSLIDAEELAAIERFEQNQRPYPRDASVQELFEEQARLNPDAVALLFENESLSYRALNERANQIARHLQAQGVAPGKFVGVCLDRSPGLIASLLGVLKAGAAFVPFDAKYPKTRLEYLFADSEVRLLITDSRRHAHIAPPGTRTMLLDLVQPEISAQSTENLPRTSNGGSIAYMMYTSGSTGNPKGTLIPHRAISRLVKNSDFASFSPEEVFLAFAPVSFDASTFEIWGPLLNGAKLAIYPPEFESVEQFESVLQRYGVTTLWLTAGLFNTIVDRNPKSLAGIKQLLAGGDVLSVAHIRKAQAALPNTKIINGYGPTENTTFTCCYTIPKNWPENRSIPIGTPVSNTEVFILDDGLQRVPIGVPGDLYAGGDGLSLGYWKRPELTERSFLQNPFDPEKRIYKTGDRARFLEDGSIEFLGRRDGQVKIRGFRIEIGEVEAAFRQLQGVRDLAVVAHPGQNGGKALVAYLVPAGNGQSDPAEFLREVSALLPAHACPSRIVLLDELPLGANGKVNRAALPLPTDEKSEQPLSPPANPIEEKLVQIWRQILEVPRLGVDDNFFHLGGESLRATRAVSQMNMAFNCRLTLPRLFEAPTVRQMARLVETSAKEDRAGPMKNRVTSPNDISDISKLSDDDVDLLLNQLLETHDSAR